MSHWRDNHADLVMQNITAANNTDDAEMKRLAIETAKVHALMQLAHSVAQVGEKMRTVLR